MSKKVNKFVKANQSTRSNKSTANVVRHNLGTVEVEFIEEKGKPTVRVFLSGGELDFSLLERVLIDDGKKLEFARVKMAQSAELAKIIPSLFALGEWSYHPSNKDFGFMKTFCAFNDFAKRSINK